MIRQDHLIKYRDTIVVYNLEVLGHFAQCDIFWYLGILEHLSIENKTRKTVIIYKCFGL